MGMWKHAAEMWQDIATREERNAAELCEKIAEQDDRIAALNGKIAELDEKVARQDAECELLRRTLRHYQEEPDTGLVEGFGPTYECEIAEV